MQQGFILLHRKSLESMVFQNPNLWQVWCYCLLRANHRENKIFFEGKEINLEPGQFVTGRFQGSKDCKMKPSTFRNQLVKLKSLGNLDIESDNKNSIITIVNWAQYQDTKQKKDSKKDNKRTTKGQQKDTNNNDNNENNVNKINKGVPMKIEKEYFSDLLPIDSNQEFIDCWTEWIDYCSEKRNKLTRSTAKKQINFLLKQSNPVECINRSIQNGWKGLFEVKNGSNTSKQGIRGNDGIGGSHNYSKPEKSKFNYQ